MNAIPRVPAELARSIRPAVEAALTPEQLTRVFANVRFKELAAFSAPEPSIGAAVRLANGKVATLAYGKGSQLLRVDLPESDSVSAFLSEVTLPLDSITWRRRDSTEKSSGVRPAPRKSTKKLAAKKPAPRRRATVARPVARKAAASRRSAPKGGPAPAGKGSSGRSGSPRRRSR